MITLNYLPSDKRRTSSHSTRIGAAQDLANANTEMPGIMLADGWKDSRQVVRYI